MMTVVEYEEFVVVQRVDFLGSTVVRDVVRVPILAQPDLDVTLGLAFAFVLPVGVRRLVIVACQALTRPAGLGLEIAFGAVHEFRYRR